MNGGRSARWVCTVKTEFTFYTDKKNVDGLKIYIVYKDLRITRFTCVLSISMYVRVMSFKSYLHECAQNSRRNEVNSYIMFLAGLMFFIGGVLESLKLAKNPRWFIFIPYHTEPLRGAVLGLALTISGLALIVYGITAGLKYWNDRRWYMQEMRKATSFEEIALKVKKDSIKLEKDPEKVRKRIREFRTKLRRKRKQKNEHETSYGRS